MTSAAAEMLVRRLGGGAGKPEQVVCPTTFVAESPPKKL